MSRKPKLTVAAAALRRRAETRLLEFCAQEPHRPMMAALYRRAEARLRKRRKPQRSKAGIPKSDADPRRLLQELQVHQVELEMQNTELQAARDRMETLLENYTDLYDFAPVGYFSLDEAGQIFEVNLTGAALLGVERSRLIHRPLPLFVVPTSQPTFENFLKRTFAGSGKQVCEVELRNEDGVTFWADLQAVPAVSLRGAGKWCRVAVSDITVLKRADEAQRRMEALALANREMKREIVRRQAVEAALKQSKRRQSELLQESRDMQERLRRLARRVLRVQEEERKEVSRELHDEIAQTLVGINVHLENLTRDLPVNPKVFKQRIARTQRLVGKAVDTVHRFARDLRPTMLDDLGLIPALHGYLKEFTKRTKVRVQFTAFAGVEQLSSARRTVLYRIAQSALTNIARHPRASQVRVSLHKVQNTVRLEVQDDGKSFDTGRVLFAKRHTRLGLLGMRERAEMFGGSFAVESAPGQGTTIRAQIPFGNGTKA